MQGAGNDFVVLDGTAAPIELSREQLKKLGDRRFVAIADRLQRWTRAILLTLKAADLRHWGEP